MIIKMSPVTPYARRQVNALMKVKGNHNDSKSEDRTLKNDIRAPTTV